jgi:hypothetical protein
MTAEEIFLDEARRRRASRDPLLSAAAAMVTAAAVAVSGMAFGFRSRNFGAQRTFFTLSQATAAFIGVAFVTFVLFYVVQVSHARRRKRRSSTSICTTCFELHTRGTIGRCPCGGGLDDAINWTRNRCPGCGYDIRVPTRRCPECGRSLDDVNPRAPRLPPRPKDLR